MQDSADPGRTILTVNAGSSSIKLAVFPGETPETPALTAMIERIGTPEAAAKLRWNCGERESIPLDDASGKNHDAALAAILPRLAEKAPAPIAAAGHRIVHGGDAFTGSVVVDEAVLSALDRLVPLARTHQPQGIAAIRAVGRAWPDIPQVACFDTAFHATIPPQARAIALPERMRRAGVRRYGFHGLSYNWIATQLPGLLGEASGGRVVVAHLGNGASLCGMVGLQSHATTMGFTPLDGLVMGERPGLTDPGAILFLLEELGMSVEDLRETLFRKSGLLGLSGLSNDMRALAASDTARARFAIEVYVHRAVHEIGAIAAEIGGIDAFVFTGGVGENAATIRAAIMERLDWLGMAIDPDANGRNARTLSAPASKPVLITPANEEAVIARDTREVLAQPR